jgi:hypothetical protein
MVQFNALGYPDVATEIDAARGRICEQDSDELIQPFILFSCVIDGDRIDTADLTSPGAPSLWQHGEYVPWQQLIDRLEHNLPGF